MAPVLLDQRTIFRAGIAVSLTMSVVFFAGYYTGYHKADYGRGMGLNKTIALALPGPAHAETTEYEQHLPQAQIPGANIDVDSPDHKAAASIIGKQAGTHVHQTEAEVEIVINETANLIGKPATSGVSGGQDNQRLQLASLTITPGIIEPDKATAAIEAVDDKRTGAGDKQQFNRSIEADRKVKITDTASAEDARYTIQVGVFADSGNAIRRMSELEAYNLSAYTEGYSHKRDELRFNVRFGYFKDKSSAVAALVSFQQNLSGSGYVAKIRRN